MIMFKACPAEHNGHRILPNYCHCYVYSVSEVRPQTNTHRRHEHCAHALRTHHTQTNKSFCVQVRNNNHHQHHSINFTANTSQLLCRCSRMRKVIVVLAVDAIAVLVVFAAVANLVACTGNSSYFGLAHSRNKLTHIMLSASPRCDQSVWKSGTAKCHMATLTHRRMCAWMLIHLRNTIICMS